MKLQLTYYRDDQEESISRKMFYILAWIFTFIFFFFLGTDIMMEEKYQFILVSGRSMQNTINPNPIPNGGQDGVYIRLTQDVTYGDIVVHQKEDSISIIKRVMAMEGDKICIARVPIEGEDREEIRFMRVKRGSSQIEVVEEDYIKSYDDWNNNVTQHEGQYYEINYYNTYVFSGQTTTLSYNGEQYKFSVIPQDKIFLMGDNRMGSTDCRQNGPVDFDGIQGRVVKIAHDIYSYKNSPFYLFNYVGSYLSVVWEEIVSYFTF